MVSICKPFGATGSSDAAVLRLIFETKLNDPKTKEEVLVLDEICKDRQMLALIQPLLNDGASFWAAQAIVTGIRTDDRLIGYMEAHNNSASIANALQEVYSKGRPWIQKYPEILGGEIFWDDVILLINEDPNGLESAIDHIEFFFTFFPRHVEARLKRFKREVTSENRDSQIWETSIDIVRALQEIMSISLSSYYADEYTAGMFNDYTGNIQKFHK